MKKQKKKHFEIDWSVGYEFNKMEQMVKDGAKEHKVSVSKYIENAKTAFKNLAESIIQEIADSNDVVYLTELIENLNDARCEWTIYDRYDFERFLKPEGR